MIKLKDLLLEHPDLVRDSNNWVADSLHSDARTFILDPDSDFWIMGKGERWFHDGIASMLFRIYNENDGDKTLISDVLTDLVDNDSNLSMSTDLSRISDFIKSHLNDEQGEFHEAKGSRMFGITGRVWLDKKIISFWQELKVVKENLRVVDSFIRDAVKIAPDQLKFDFIDKLDESPLYTFKDLLKGVEFKKNEKYKELLKIQHLDPKAKKELEKLKPQSSSGVGAKKYAGAAEKAGFKTPAEFNYAHQFAENVDKPIKLKDLLENCVYESNAVSNDQRSYFDKFVEYVKKFLSIKGHYPVYIVDQNEVPTTTAYFDPESEIVKVAVKGRALPDCLRSLGHEFVHAKQHEMGELHEKSGQTGSKQENQANSLAGIMMRNFSKECPEIYNTDEKQQG